MQEDIKEGLASIYLTKPKEKNRIDFSASKKNIFILAFIFITLSIFGILLILVLNL